MAQKVVINGVPQSEFYNSLEITIVEDESSLLINLSNQVNKLDEDDQIEKLGENLAENQQEKLAENEGENQGEIRFSRDLRDVHERSYQG